MGTERYKCKKCGKEEWHVFPGRQGVFMLCCWCGKDDEFLYPIGDKNGM